MLYACGVVSTTFGVRTTLGYPTDSKTFIALFLYAIISLFLLSTEKNKKRGDNMSQNHLENTVNVQESTKEIINYHTMQISDIYDNLQTKKEGLSSDEATNRIEQYGKNELQDEERKSVFQVFLSQFADLLVIILLVCAGISMLTNNAESAIVILCVVVMNSIIGTVQHVKAEKSLAALKSMSAPYAKVLRDNNVCSIPANEVTIGDIVLLEAGNVPPADGRIIESAELLVNESSLTGESENVIKTSDILEQTDKEILLGDRKNMIYSGSLITGGRGTMVVTNIGMNTEIGKIATLINKADKKKTPLQKSLDSFSKWLSVGILIICAFVMLLSILRGDELIDALLFALALAVAAIPEALTSIVTISLAIGTQKMAKEHAVIKELTAVESLGCVNVICSDKTGTLTQNKMTVKSVYENTTATDVNNSIDKDIDYSKLISADLYRAMILCNDSVFGQDKQSTIGDPTETALIEVFGNDFTNEVRNALPRVSELPFDSDRKLMSTLHNINNELVMYTKGAVDNIVPKLTKILDNNIIRDITNDDIDKINDMNLKYSQEGMRVLCFTKRIMPKETLSYDDECDFIFVGLSAMTDPPRPESIQAVSECISAGIKPIMITGDHKITACAIAKQIGIFKDGDVSLDGHELETMSDGELLTILPKVSVYARVSPEHKIRIVTLWQSLGNIVSMTGDGVNDAPALKKADIGVAMGITGTDVSKDAASMILTDDNFATIVKAVANGRNIYANIKNSIMFLLTGNFAGILTVLYAALASLPTPFTAVHLLFINLLTDSLPAIAISMEKADGDLLKEKPRNIKDKILDKTMLINTGVIGALICVSTVIAFHMGLKVDSETACTMAFATLCLARLFHCFNCRSKKPVTAIGFRSNPFSIYAFLAGVCFLAIALFVTPLHGILDVVPLTISQLGMILGLAFLPTLIIQAVKMFKN